MTHTPNRRDVLRALAAGVAIPFLPHIARAQTPDISPLTQASRDAWLFGIPLIENAQSRAAFLRQSPPNTLLHKRTLSDWKERFITTPNNDTLYSHAWLDLAAGPVRLHIPPTGSRYVSVALMDMYTNNFAILGTRTTGTDGGDFTIIGPDAPRHSPLDIRAPTRWTFLLVRLLIDGLDDLAAAHHVQDQFILQKPNNPSYTVPSYPSFSTKKDPWQTYFASLQALLVENPPYATDERALNTFAPLGIGLNTHFEPTKFTASQINNIAQGIELARRALKDRQNTGFERAGWLYPRSDLGDFHEAYLYRAQVAIGGLYALPPQEALYIRPLLTAEQTALPQGKSLLIRFPAGQLPPVQAFWSLSMYKKTSDGQYFFFPNEINRYSIGNRTPHLTYNSDGGLDIWISRQAPSGNRRSNWLPAPPTGEFGLFLRAYLPESPLVLGSYHFPRVLLV